MIYIVCSNAALGVSYVENELKRNPSEREIRYVNQPSSAHGITLILGDQVHLVSTTEHPMTWSLYEAWMVVERSSGLPPRQIPPYLN